METDNDKYAFRCFLLRLGFMETLLQCIGNTISIIWSADTMTFTGYRYPISQRMCADTLIAQIWQNQKLVQRILQYRRGRLYMSVTMNVYTHIGFDDADEELKRMEEFRKAQAEVEKKKEKTMSWKMFKVI